MPRPARLFKITQILQGGSLHRAGELARALDVSVRTIYRDMDRLSAAGLPVTGTRGAGYRLAKAVALPPLTLTTAEFEALNLGLAVVAQAADEGLKAAACSLSEKIDAATATHALADSDLWQFAASPFSDATRNLTHMPLFRSAIRAHQKVRITYSAQDGSVTGRVIRPLRMEYWGHAWALTAWCDWRAAFRVFRLDLIESTEALPELFVDEPGKTIRDFTP